MELMGLVSSWTTLVAIAISSTSIPNLRDAGAIRRVRPSTGDNMKKFFATIMTMTRFHVVAIAAGLLLAVSGPSFAAKRTLQKSDTKSAVKSQSRATKFPYPYSRDPYPYSRDDPYAPGVNWPKGA